MKKFILTAVSSLILSTESNFSFSLPVACTNPPVTVPDANGNCPNGTTKQQQGTDCTLNDGTRQSPKDVCVKCSLSECQIGATQKIDALVPKQTCYIYKPICNAK